MIAELLENVDRLQRLRVCAAQESLNLRRFDEQAVQLKLEVRRTTEDDLFVFDGHWIDIWRFESLNGANMDVQYLDSKSFVRRMMNFVTRPPSSLSFFSHSALTASLASASRPLMIAFSKFFRKSFFDPRKLGLAKLSSEKYSDKSF